MSRAESGGADSHGRIFNLVPLSNGSWGLHVLHNFTGGSDGASPPAGVTLHFFGIFGTASAVRRGVQDQALGLKFSLMLNAGRCAERASLVLLLLRISPPA